MYLLEVFHYKTKGKKNIILNEVEQRRNCLMHLEKTPLHKEKSD